MNDDDIDVLLREYAPRWRSAQPPAPTAETARRLASANLMRRPAPTRTAWSTAVRRWLRQALPVVATGAAVALLAGGLGLVRTHTAQAPSHRPTPSPGVVVWRALPQTNPSIPTTITSPSPDPLPAAVLPPCGAEDLRGSARGAVAQGTRTITVEFRSTGPRCQLNGIPVVTPLDPGGRVVEVPIEHETPEYGNAVAVDMVAPAVLKLFWTSSWCAEEIEVASLRLDIGDGTETFGGFGKSQCYGVPGSGRKEPIRVTEFRPEHFETGRAGTPFDDVSVEADLPATAKTGETITFRVTLTAPRDLALDPCPDVSISFGDRADYGLNCDGVPYRDGSGRPYLPAGTPVSFVARATAPTTPGRNVKVTWQLIDTSAVGGGTVEVLAVR